MFGYVTVNKPEIKFKDFDVYRSFYCGLCRELRERYGIPGQISLTYDMTFAVLLLSALYEPPTKKGTSRCVVHPLKPQPVRKNTVTEYCADMNVILTYYKCMDDWQDEHKPLHYAYARILKNCGNMHMSDYPEKIQRIRGALEPGVPDVSWKRFWPSVRMSGNRPCAVWDFISENLSTSWMLMMMWKKMQKTEITILSLKNIR